MDMVCNPMNQFAIFLRRGCGRRWGWGFALGCEGWRRIGPSCERLDQVQGYLAHKKNFPPRTLQQDYLGSYHDPRGGGGFLCARYPCRGKCTKSNFAEFTRFIQVTTGNTFENQLDSVFRFAMEIGPYTPRSPSKTYPLSFER